MCWRNLLLSVHWCLSSTSGISTEKCSCLIEHITYFVLDIVLYMCHVVSVSMNGMRLKWLGCFDCSLIYILSIFVHSGLQTIFIVFLICASDDFNTAGSIVYTCAWKIFPLCNFISMEKFSVGRTISVVHV